MNDLDKYKMSVFVHVLTEPQWIENKNNLKKLMFIFKVGTKSRKVSHPRHQYYLGSTRNAQVEF